MSKIEIIKKLPQILQKALKPEIIKAAFACTGIWPCDQDAAKVKKQMSDSIVTKTKTACECLVGWPSSSSSSIVLMFPCSVEFYGIGSVAYIWHLLYSQFLVHSQTTGSLTRKHREQEYKKPAEPTEPDDQILDPLPSENEDNDGSASDSNSGSESDEVDEDRAAEIDDILREHLLNNRKK